MLLDGSLVGAIAVAAGLYGLQLPSYTEDEFSLLIYSDLLQDGRVPNRDFFTPYGPGTLWPVSLANVIAGHSSLLAERLVGLTYHALLAVGVSLLAATLGRRSAVLAGVLSGVLSATLGLTAYGWLGALAATVWCLAMASRRRFLVAGVLGAVAVTIRPEFAVVVLPTASVLLRDRVAVWRLVTGAALGGIPLWWHLTVAGRQLVHNTFLDRLAVNGRMAFPSPASPVWWAFMALVLSVLLLATRAILRPSREAAAVALLGVLLLPQALQRTDSDHVTFVAVAVVPLAFAALLRAASGFVVSSSLDAALGALLTLAVALAIPAFVAVAIAAPRGDALRIDGREIITTGPSTSEAIRRTVHVVSNEVPRGSTFFVGATDMSRFAVTSTYLYYLLPDRVPDAYYLELAPGVSERRGSGLLSDIKDSQFLVLTRVDPQQELARYPYLKQGTRAMNHEVEAHFCRVASVSEVDVYRRCR